MSEEIKATIEAILFVSGERVGQKEMLEVLNISAPYFQQIMQEMMLDYSQAGRGIQILSLDGGYIMATKPEYSPAVSKMTKTVSSKLSSAALETLAIIAYRQPVSKAEIEQIRGVKTDRVITTLMQKGLIKELGKKEVPGKPTIYGTTYEFLQLFSLSSLEDLPELAEE